MRPLSTEARNIQNPALGATLLWRFSVGYTESHPTHDPTPLPIAFFVLPILLHEKIEEVVNSTQKASGLRAFAAKFATTDRLSQDLLLSIHDRINTLRQLSLDSLQIAASTRLLHVSTNGTIGSTMSTPVKSGISREPMRLMRNAEKFGNWCGVLTIHEIVSTLRIRI